MAEKGDAHWMEKAFAKNKGSLHKDLNVKTGRKIPAGKMRAAAEGKHGKKDKKKAIAAENAKHANEKRDKKR